MTTRKNVQLRGVGTVRISLDRPEQTSTSTQVKAIDGHCDLHDIDLIETVEDKGQSAFKKDPFSRPGLRRALQLIDAGAANVLVCWRIDRVARNARDLLALLDWLKERGASFVSVSENFDTTTPMGRAMATIVAALAELESAIKSERTSVWQEHRRENGAVPTGPRPCGYQRKHNTLVVDRGEAKAIRKAATELLDGGSLKAAVRMFNAAGGRSDGRQISLRGLTLVLTSPTIAALRPVEGTVSQWQKDGRKGVLIAASGWKPILDRETWEKVVAILNDPARRSSPGNGRRHLLSGLLECGVCGKPMRTKTHPRGPRYQCPTGHNGIPIADTDRVVQALIFDRVDLVAWRRMRSRGTRRVDTAELERQLSELTAMKERDELYFDEWKQMRADIISRLESAAAEPVPLPKVDDPVKAWPSLDVEARRLIVTAFLPELVVAPANPKHRRVDALRIKTRWDPAVEPADS